MAGVTLTPETFTLVEFDADAVRRIVEEIAATVGIPAGTDIHVDVDEALPSPLAGSTADVVDGRVELWFTGGDWEDTHRLRQFDEPRARTRIAMSLLRAADRLRPEFAGAPRDAELSDAQRAVWDVSAEGRAARLGFTVQEPRRHYTFRLYCGFTDVADDEYARLWAGAPLSWETLASLTERLVEADPRPRAKRAAKQRRETLRNSATG